MRPWPLTMLTMPIQPGNESQHTPPPISNWPIPGATNAANTHMEDELKIFCDASVCLQNSPGSNQTGIGILVLSKSTRNVSSASFFQVAIRRTLEPLEAEARALLLGAKLAVALNLQVATLLTDNQVLASVIQARSPRTQPGHWSLRPVIAEFQELASTRRFSVIKIGRQENMTADTLAKKARRTTVPNSCLFSCQALGHSSPYNVGQMLEHFDWGDLYPISVLCL